MKKNRFIFILLFVAGIVYGIFYFHIYNNFPDIANSFDHRYTDIGKYLAEEGRYAIRGDDGVLISTFQAPPLYPVLSAISFRILGDERSAYEMLRFIHIVMVLGIIYLTYRIGQLFSERIGRMASLFAALDFSMFYFANDYEMPDTTNAFFAILFTLFFLRFLKGEFSYRTIALSAFFLGLSIWTKTTLYVLWIPLSLFLLLFVRKGVIMKSRAKWCSVAIFAVIMMLFFGGWKVRNYHVIGFSEFSSQSGPVMLWAASALKAYQNDLPFGEAQANLKAQYLTPDKRQLSEGALNVYLQEEAKKIIFASPIDYAITWARGIPGLMLGTFPPYILFSREVKDDVYAIIYEAQGHRSVVDQLWEKGYKGYLFIYGLSKIHLFLIYGFSVVGILILLRRRSEWWVVAFMTIMVAYVLAVSSPASHQRYRAVIMPIFYVLCGIGITYVFDKLRGYRYATLMRGRW